MLVRFHYKDAPLDLVWLDHEIVRAVETAKAGGTEVLCSNGLQYTLLETPDTVARRLEQARLGNFTLANPGLPELEFGQ